MTITMIISIAENPRAFFSLGISMRHPWAINSQRFQYKCALVGCQKRRRRVGNESIGSEKPTQYFLLKRVYQAISQIFSDAPRNYERYMKQREKLVRKRSTPAAASDGASEELAAEAAS